MWGRSRLGELIRAGQQVLGEMLRFVERAATYLGKPFDRLPRGVRGYVLASIEVAAAAIFTEVVLHAFRTRAPLLFTLVYFVLIMSAAWLGYGPGLLVCATTTYVLPPLLLGRAPRIDPGRLGLLVVISLLISSISASKRRTESALRAAAEQLEQRVRERTLELKNSEQSLREQTQLLELARDAIVTADAQGAVCFWSRGAEQVYGWSRDEVAGKIAHDLLRTVFPEPRPTIEQRLLTQGFWQGEVVQFRRDGSRCVVMSRAVLRRDADGAPCGWLEINTDVTEARQIEEQLRHTQKMESVGRLAGGVAHDFNNLLTVINGYADMLMAEEESDSYRRGALVEIRSAGERAAGLTRQLLAFSRKQVVQPAVLNLNDLVSDMERMLRRLIGENIAIVSRLAPDLGNVKADAGQVQQILMNLAVNARDAMPHGGSLILETSNVTFDESSDPMYPGMHPGEYILLAVTDTGTGMSPEVKERLFEPFFTTKAQGSGTGLGLAMVYGMVKQSGGWIWVYSEPGHGSVFKVYLPRIGESLALAAPRLPDALTGNETILLVEDEREVREVAIAALERYGYRVIQAASGEAALGLSDQYGDRINLLLTDVVLPGIPGTDLAARLHHRCPNMPVVFISGYTEGAFTQRGVLESHESFLQKPFTPAVLAETVRSVLGELQRR